MIVLPLLKGLLARELNLQQLAALTVVCTQPGCSLHTIIEELGCGKATGHGLMTRLVEAGLIERTEHVSTGRLLALNPTPAGAQEYYRLVQLAGMAAAAAA